MSDSLPAWAGDLYTVKGLSQPLVGVTCIIVSSICGGIVGLERERSDKPAGLRTHILICMGSAVFTLASILISSGDEHADRTRIAAQIVTGIGFLGAGAIIHERRYVVGLTTAASIWSVAAVGILVGGGYVVPGFVLTLLIYLVLTVVKSIEIRLAGECDLVRVRVRVRRRAGKARALVQAVVDDHRRSIHGHEFLPGDNDREFHVVFSYCRRHRVHRGILAALAQIDDVESIEEIAAANDDGREM